MPGTLVEVRAVTTALGEYDATRHDDSPQPPPQGELHLGLVPTRAAQQETPPFSETEFAIQDRVRSLISSFSEFPSGLHFPDRIFYDTCERVTDEYGQVGLRIITADTSGEMAMVEAYEHNEWGEWDISPECSRGVPLTSFDVRNYATSLLETMTMRFTEPRLRVAKEKGDLNRIAAIQQDLKAVEEAKQAISNLLAEPVQPHDFAA